MLIVDAMHSQGLWDERGRLLLRRLPRRRRRRGPDQGPVDRRACCRCSATVVLGPDLLELRRAPSEALRGVPRALTTRGASARGRGRVVHRADGDAPGRRRHPAGERRAACSPGCSTRTSSSPPTACARCRSTTRSIRCRSTSPGRWSRSTTSRRSPRTGMFGGNSNWRGPVWMPVNYLVLRSLQRYAQVARRGGRDRVPHRQRPHRSGSATCADDLRRRLDLAVPARARRPATLPRLGRPGCRTTPGGATTSTFNEYFHGDNGAGLGATHQTGWTGLVADLICRPDPFAGDRQPWEL